MYMNNNKFTQKTLEALQAAQQTAIEYQHNAVEPEHMLLALVTQQQGLIPQLLQTMGAEPGTFSAAWQKNWRRCPGCPALGGTRTRCISPMSPIRCCTLPRGPQPL